MSRGRGALALIALGLVVATVTALGIGSRATYGAQTTADEPQYLLSALSLWEDGDLDIADELVDERYRDFHEVDLPQQTVILEDGRQISPHDPLLPVLLAIPMGLGGWVAAKATLAVLAGVLAALVAWTAVARFGVSRRVAYPIAAVFSLAPPLAVYATQVYPELPAAVALLAGFAAVTGSFQRAGRVVFVFSVIALPWLAVKYIPVAAALAVAGLVRAGKGRRLGLVGVLAAAGVLYTWAHLAIYGGLTPYATGDHFVGGEFTVVGTEVNLWGRSTRLNGLLVDRSFGLAAWQPAFLVLPLVGAWAVARRQRSFAIAAWLLGIGWVMATFVALTMHGWWFPGRQLVVVLPIAVVLIAVWANRTTPWQRKAVGLVAALGVVAFGFLLVEGSSEQLTWVVDFGSTTNPFYRTLATVLPDYMSPTNVTWVLHGFWVLIAATLGWLGWRAGSLRRGDSAPLDSIDGYTKEERVLI